MKDSTSSDHLVAVKMQAKEECNKTSGKGSELMEEPEPSIHYLSPSSMIMKALKLTIVTVCVLVLLYEIKECLWRYLAFETSVILAVRPTEDATFVAITVCPSFSSAYKEERLTHYGLTQRQYQYGFYNTSDPNYRSVFEDVAHSLVEIVERISLTTIANEGNDKIDVDLDEASTGQGLWRRRYNNLYGRCFSLELAESVVSLGISRLEMSAKIDTYVFLHYPGQYMDFNSKTKLPIYRGQRLFIDVSYENNRDTLGPDSASPCEPLMDLAFDACLDAALPLELEKEFGCTLPFFPGPEEIPVCDPKDSEKAFNRYAFLSSNGQRQLCEQPCSNTEVFTGLPFWSDNQDPSRGYLKVYLKSTTKVKKTVLDYTWVSMLAEIGGYTGLLLGVSLVNVNGIITWAFVRSRV